MEDVESSNTDWDSAMTSLENELSNLRTVLGGMNQLNHADCQMDFDCQQLYDTHVNLTIQADPSQVNNPPPPTLPSKSITYLYIDETF